MKFKLNRPGTAKAMHTRECELLNALHTAKTSINLTELAAHLGWDRVILSGYLKGLEAEGKVEKIEIAKKRYEYQIALNLN